MPIRAPVSQAARRAAEEEWANSVPSAAAGVGAPMWGAEGGDPTAFLVDHEDRVWWEGAAEGGGEGGELGRVDDVAREQDHAGGGMGAEECRLVRGEVGAGDADDRCFHAIPLEAAHSPRGSSIPVSAGSGWVCMARTKGPSATPT